MELIQYIIANLSEFGNYPFILIGIICIVELIVRLTPTEKDNSILNTVVSYLVKIVNVLPNKAAPDASGKTRKFSLKTFITKKK